MPDQIGYLATYEELSGETPTCSFLMLLITFSPCQLQGQIDWHATDSINRAVGVEKVAGIRDLGLALVYLAAKCDALTWRSVPDFCVNTLFGTPGGTRQSRSWLHNHLITTPSLGLPWKIFLTSKRN